MSFNPTQFMQARHKARLAQSQQDDEAKKAQDLHQQAMDHQKRMNAVELAAKKADLDHQKAMNAARLAKVKNPPATKTPANKTVAKKPPTKRPPTNTRKKT